MQKLQWSFYKPAYSCIYSCNTFCSACHYLFLAHFFFELLFYNRDYEKKERLYEQNERHCSILQHYIWEMPSGMRAEIPGRSHKNTPFPGKDVDIWTFFLFFFFRKSWVFVCFPVALWTALDMVVCIGWVPWFSTKGHVLMPCFWSGGSGQS